MVVDLVAWFSSKIVLLYVFLFFVRTNVRYVSQLKGSSDISDGKTRGDDLITFQQLSEHQVLKNHLLNLSGRGRVAVVQFSSTSLILMIDVIKLKRTIISRLS